MVKEERKPFYGLLRRLAREGKIERLRSGRYRLPGSKAPKENRRPPGKATPPRKERPPKKEAPSIGSLKGVKVLGNFVRTGNTGVVVPRDSKIPPLVVATNEIKGIENGTLVVVEIRGRRGGDARPHGTILEALGKAGVVEVERKGLFHHFELPLEFPREVLAEAEGISDAIPPREASSRVDLRKRVIFTIDNDTAKDFDDAVGVEAVEGGGYRLTVSIADVSHYLKPGTALDNEAINRATSIYLPEDVVPMLPEKLSNWVCSLVPNEDRLTKTVEMEFDGDGRIVGVDIYNSVIRSHARLTYSLVSDLLEGRAQHPELDEGVRRRLFLMKDLYRKLKRRRVENGELDFDFPEPELIQNELGRTIDIIKSTRDIAHGLIEEFMIAANHAVATHIFNSKNTSIYRVHEPPALAGVKELAEALKKLGFSLKVGRKVDPKEFQRVIREAKGTNHQLAVNTMILQSLNRAVYSISADGHFGLALDHYTHFTSPIRRYPDLVVHRITDAVLKRRPIPYDEGVLEGICSQCSVKERFADEVEREAIEIERVEMMQAHIGKEFQAFVTSVMPFGLFVELEDYFVEGLVPRRMMEVPRGKRFEVGESVMVKLVASDLMKRRMTFRLVK